MSALSDQASGASPAQPLIVLTGAAFGYGAAPVVSAVDVEIRTGTFLGVLGPNGSGKTTLLRGILGLIAPSAGTVRNHAGKIAYVPQREALDPVYPATVEEVVQLGAYGRLVGLRGLPRDERASALQSLERVGLVDQRRKLFSSLSGGQRQRALIARALVVRPNVLILDEPTSGVDRPTQDLILELITRLNREDDMAILIVSHQLAMTRTVRDVLWVSDGRVQRGTAEELLRPERLKELFGVSAGAFAASGSGWEVD